MASSVLLASSGHVGGKTRRRRAKAEADFPSACQNDKASRNIILDVNEHIERTGTVCVYDIKTGASGLTRRRMFEIAKNAYGAFPHAKRFIVTELRPKPW